MKTNKTACLGVGVIGSSWITNFALKGYEVGAYDSFPDALALAKERVETNLRSLARNDVLQESEIESIVARITFTKSIEEAVSGASFVQENVMENYEAKHAIVGEFEKYAPADAIFASSTSGLLITEIAKVAKHPERFVGAHPYNPPHLIPLVELTKGEKTSPEVLKTAKEFYISIGKEPVVLQKEALGFISNRIQIAVGREMAELVLRGVCTVEDADKALTFGPGIRYGILGQMLIWHLGGGKIGIDGLFEQNVGKSVEMWLDDMAKWTKFPEGWWKTARKGVEEEMANRPKEIGNTQESVAEYRDKMLIGLLRLHNKL